MPGLFGPAPGGPGSIWKIDRLTGVVTLFANVTFNGADNTGPALGGLAFDPASRSLFVADRGTGMIHRFALDGTEQGVYDHGAQGRPAAGLPAVAYDPAKRLDITNPQFNTEDWKTWGYAAAERLVFGLAARDGRLYYAVKDQLQIWSVSIAGGAFGADARIEINVPPGDGETEISKILFDDLGRMLLAERPVPFGDYGFEALTQEGIGRVLRYARQPDGRWQAAPDEYAIGFPLQLRNGNGGVAIGYDYMANGAIDRSRCGGYLWSTGEELRVSHDPALAAQLAAGGPADVNGLQGNGIELVRPQNVPPLRSYYIDYDDQYDDAAAHGHMGDVAIYRVCGPGQRVGLLPGLLGLPVGPLPPIPPLGPPPPPNVCVPGTTGQPGFQCCPFGTSMDPSGQCVSWCPPGVDPNQSTNGTSNLLLCAYGWDPTTYDPANIQNLRCLGGAQPNFIAQNNIGDLRYICLAYSPGLNPPVCPAGYTKGTVGQGGVPGLPPTGNPAIDNQQACVPNQQQQQSCGQGQQVGFDGQCPFCTNGGIAFPLTPPTTGQCCPDGSVVTSTGYCCPPGATIDPTTGKCGPPLPCPPGDQPVPVGGGWCCPAGLKAFGDPPICCSGIPGSSTQRTVCPGQQPAQRCPSTPPPGNCCPAGTVPNPVTGGCCPPGTTPDPVTGSCQGGKLPCPPQPVPVPGSEGQCCPAGTIPLPNGQCCTTGTGGPKPSGRKGGIRGRDILARLSELFARAAVAQGPVLVCDGAIVPPQTCPPKPVDGNCCPDGTTYNPQTGSCQPNIPLPCPPQPVPYPTKPGLCCLPGFTPVGANGAAGCQGPDGARQPPQPCPPAPPPGSCCPDGTTYNPQTGQCQPSVGQCPPGWTPNPRGGCCQPGSTPDPRTGSCLPIETPTCPPSLRDSRGQCCQPPSRLSKPGGQCCALDQVPNPYTGQCCLVGMVPLPNGCCARDQIAGGVCCPAGTKPGGAGNRLCVSSACPEGTTPDPKTGICCTTAAAAVPSCSCPPGQILIRGKCSPRGTHAPPPPPPPPTGVPPLVGPPLLPPPTPCHAGQHLRGERCVCDNTGQPPSAVSGQCVSHGPSCPPGAVSFGASTQCLCRNGKPPVGGSCVTKPTTPPTLHCRGGQRAEGGRCVTIPTRCGRGQRLEGGRCVTIPLTPRCKPSERPVGGRCVSVEHKPKPGITPPKRTRTPTLTPRTPKTTPPKRTRTPPTRGSTTTNIR
jgi:hypothetical protein